MLPEVEDVLIEAYRTRFANPASRHVLGLQSARALEGARLEMLEELSGSLDHHLIFTSGSTESLNILVQGLRWRRIGVLATEHPGVMKLCSYVSRRAGAELVTLPVLGDGVVDLEELARFVGDSSALVVAQWANGDTGVVQPIREVCRIAHGAGALVVSDATQAALWLDLSLCGEAPDGMVFSSHKIGGPHGVGALFVRQDLKHRLTPLTIGGGQELSVRPGTVPVPEVLAFKMALRIAVSRRAANRQTSARLRDHFESMLGDALGIRVYGGDAPRIPNTSGFVVPGVSGRALQSRLPDVAVGTGAACASGATDDSHVLAAMGASPSDRRGLIRASLGTMTTAEDVERGAQMIVRAVSGFQRGGERIDRF